MKTSTVADYEKFRDCVLEESRKGRVVFMGVEGPMVAPLDEFIKQPAEGILYDLNRLPEVVLTFIHDPKWANDFAVYMVIKRLREQCTALESTAKERGKCAECDQVIEGSAYCFVCRQSAFESGYLEGEKSAREQCAESDARIAESFEYSTAYKPHLYIARAIRRAAGILKQRGKQDAEETIVPPESSSENQGGG